MPSTVIKTFEYDLAAQRLAVTFHTGRRYAYFGVPKEVVIAFRGAPSLGEYFNATIRDHYPFERLR
jgi:lysyl-tRNA synthetase class 2